MDDQQNQAQPGQSFQPGQQTQPAQAPQQQPTQPQQQPMQQAYPRQQQPAYQQPQQQMPQSYAQPQDMAQVQALDASSKLDVRKLLKFGGIFLVGAILIATLAAALGGSGGSISLGSVENDELTFSASVPSGWEQSASTNGALSTLTALPTDAPENDDSAVTISHVSSPISNEAFNTQADSEVANLASSEYSRNFNTSISQLALETYNDRSFAIHYTQTSNRTDVPHSVTRQLIHASDDTIFSVRVTYTEKYQSLENSIQAIVDSLSIK